MKVLTSVCVATAVMLLVAGCSNSQNAGSGPATPSGWEPVQTVDYYKMHAAERQAMQATCRNNPGELRGTPNCINAEAAEAAVEASAKGYGLEGLKPVPAPSPKH